MNIKTALLTIGLILCLSHSGMADTQVITLKDGSTVNGEVVGLSNGVYTVKTAAMGEIQVNASNVQGINTGVAAAPAAAQGTPQASGTTADVNQKMQTMQAQLMSNPAFMADMTQMVQDPEISQLLSDPELMRIVMSKDVNAIQSNPKAQALVNNPKMKALIEKIQGSSGQ